MRKTPALLFALVLILLPPAAPSQSAAPAESRSDPNPAPLDVLARRLLDQAYKSNTLAGRGVKPWHLKADFQLAPDPGSNKPLKGSFEEWYAGPYRWRRTFTSGDSRYSGSQWSVSRLERYASNQQHEQFQDYFMTLRVARPVVDPLYQIANLKPDDQLQVMRVNTGDTAVNCVSFADPSEHGRKAEWTFPTMCFDSDLHLRLVHSEETSVQFDKFEPFQGRSVARNVKIFFLKNLIAEMTVTQLETADALEDALLNPPANAQRMPYTIEPGVSKPVSTFEVGAIIPLTSTHQPFRGTIAVPVLIQTDGSVKVTHAASPSPLQAVFDAVYGAVAKWKYQPYIVDGQPVVVSYAAPYPVDGKPFIPSYKRPPGWVPDPPAANPAPSQDSPAQVRGRRR